MKDRSMKRMLELTAICILLSLAMACCAAPQEEMSADPAGSQSAETDEALDVTEENTETNNEKESIEMKMTINDIAVEVSWENNDSTRALAEMVKEGPLTIHTEPYGGFEQVGDIGTKLPSSDTDITTEAGDIMLYTSDHMVIFYGSNSWAYTRLGRITDKSESELRELLGGSGVDVTITD